MKLLSAKSVLSAVSLATFATATFATSGAFAVAQTCTWTGTSGDYKLGTAANWSNCGGAAPKTGDILKFDSWVGPANGASTNSVKITNDLTTAAFGGLIVDGPAANGGLYVIDKIALADQANFQTVKQASGESLRVYVDALQGLGSVTLDNSLALKIVADTVNIINSSTSYDITAKNLRVASGSELVGSIDQSGTFSYKNTTNITIENGAKLYICGRGSLATISSNIIFGGASGKNPEIRFEQCMGASGDGSGPIIPSSGAVFTGTITLQSDAAIVSSNKKMVMDGSLVSNGHKLTIDAGATSLIMGKGTIGDVNLQSGSVIAPGASPGCLTTGSISWVDGATYSFDLGGKVVCDQYDQIKAIGSVNLGNGSLSIVKYGDFTPTVGDEFTIIDNDGSDANIGTFKGLAEGATFEQNGVVYKISYQGGSGNDVTLTVQNVPAVPNTGAMIIKSNPAMIAGAAVVAAIVLAGAARFASRRS